MLNISDSDEPYIMQCLCLWMPSLYFMKILCAATAWQFSTSVNDTVVSNMMMMGMEKQKSSKKNLEEKNKQNKTLSLEAKSFEICLKEFLEAEPLWQTGSLLPPGLCVVLTQKPGALSLTQMLTSVVTVLNQFICYVKLGSKSCW